MHKHREEKQSEIYLIILYVYNFFCLYPKESLEIIRRWGKVKADGNKLVIVLYMLFSCIVRKHHQNHY